MELCDNIIDSPLSHAAREGNIDVVKRLLAKGHHLNLNDNRGWTPLHEAVSHNQTDCVILFMQHEECNVDSRTFDGMTPLFVACSYQNNPHLVETLLHHGADCNIGNVEDVSPLHVACKHYKLEVIKVLVKHGAALNVQDLNGYTPLLEAIDRFSTVRETENKICLETIHFLLNSGANITLTDEYGRTPFFVAVSRNWGECIQLLLEHGASVHDRTTDGTTVLTMAAQEGILQMVEFLLDMGADPESVSADGTIALHSALHNGHISVAEKLIKRMKMEKFLRSKKCLPSFLILAIDSSSYDSFKLVMKHKIYSDHDRIGVSTLDRNTLLKNDYHFRHYEHQSPVSFLLFHHLEQPHCPLMLKDLLQSGVFGAEAKYDNDVPPLVALVAGGSCTNNTDQIKHIQSECLFTLLKNGAMIDHCSSYNYSRIPDCVLTVMLPGSCDSNHCLLLQILSRCFSRTWDELLDWVVKYKTVNVQILKVLLQLSSSWSQELLQMLQNLHKCSCAICTAEFPKLYEIIEKKTCTLKSLCRAQVRVWLWHQRSRLSNNMEDVMEKLNLPQGLKQYIMPHHLEFLAC